MRSIVKHSYLKSGPGAFGRARAHVNYIHFRSRPDRVPGQTSFFDSHNDSVSGRTVQQSIKDAPQSGVLIHKLILSPGSNDIDIQTYTRKIIDEIGHAKALDLVWYAQQHTNTDHVHAHVIIMGKDRQGRSVRFDRADHKFMCNVGDRYIEEHERSYRDVERDLERAVTDARKADPTVRELVERMAAKSVAIFRWFVNKSDAEPPWLRRRRENRYQLRRKWSNERVEKHGADEKILGRYARGRANRKKSSDKIVWHRRNGDGSSTRRVLTMDSPLPAFAELIRACKEDVHTLTKREADLVKKWLAHKKDQARDLDRKAGAIGYIELNCGEGDVRTYSPDSSPKELRSLWNAHRTGKVVLKDEEVRALSWWLSKVERDALHRKNTDQRDRGR